MTSNRSGIDASSVQTLINEALTWKYLGTTTGTTGITLPTEYKELIIKANVGTGVYYTNHYIKEELKDTAELYYSGFNNGSTNTLRIQLSKTNAQLYSVEFNGSAVTSSAVLWYYYR